MADPDAGLPKLEILQPPMVWPERHGDIWLQCQRLGVTHCSRVFGPPPIDQVWHDRWTWFGDANRDGLINIEDVPHWIWSIYSAPVDYAILSIVRWWPKTAAFLTLTPDSIYGLGAGNFISVLMLPFVPLFTMVALCVLFCPAGGKDTVAKKPDHSSGGAR
jgi:hypothetical protein